MAALAPRLFYVEQRRTYPYEGTGVIKGGPTSDPASGVYVNGTASIRKVLLFSHNGDVLVDSTWSAADGSFRFENLNILYAFYVVAVDHNGQYNGAIATHQYPQVE